MRPLITLLTDFGTADGYVAEMKGVLYSLAPEARVVDLSHEIAPQDVESARLAVARYWRRFPPQTIHLVVVDPGVGSSRDALAVRSEDRVLIGPDNGALSPALLVAGARAVSLPVPPGASPTFHGRDLFAPAAARIAMGAPIDALGAAAESPTIRRTPEARRLGNGAVQGEVISIDPETRSRTSSHSPRCMAARASRPLSRSAAERFPWRVPTPMCNLWAQWPFADRRGYWRSPSATATRRKSCRSRAGPW
jgi:S-adenosyl-L-methionine hydrolase (adenosine-forming)